MPNACPCATDIDHYFKGRDFHFSGTQAGPSRGPGNEMTAGSLASSSSPECAIVPRMIATRAAPSERSSLFRTVKLGLRVVTIPPRCAIVAARPVAPSSLLAALRIHGRDSWRERGPHQHQHRSSLPLPNTCLHVVLRDVARYSNSPRSRVSLRPVSCVKHHLSPS